MIGKVVDKKEVAEGTLQVIFRLDQEASFKPGQYIFVTIPNLLYPDTKEGKRQFSINNDPSLKNQIIITTRLSESGFKKTLKELSLGSTVELGPIAGAFVLPEDTTRPLVFLAGGIGITPFMSMLRHIKLNNLNYQITLVYSNRNQASTAFLDELKAFSQTLPNFKLILTVTDDHNWDGETRKVDSQFIKEYFPNLNENYYMVVGPPAMVEAVEKALLKAGVLPENIKKENFTGY